MRPIAGKDRAGKQGRGRAARTQGDRNIEANKRPPVAAADLPFIRLFLRGIVQRSEYMHQLVQQNPIQHDAGIDGRGLPTTDATIRRISRILIHRLPIRNLVRRLVLLVCFQHREYPWADLYVMKCLLAALTGSLVIRLDPVSRVLGVETASQEFLWVVGIIFLKLAAASVVFDVGLALLFDDVLEVEVIPGAPDPDRVVDVPLGDVSPDFAKET